MYQKERLDSILALIKENGYVTVKYLTEVLHYSNATVNRDLNILKAQKLITRTYGGVELSENAPIPLKFRYHKAKLAKRRIAECAAGFICDNDTVFIDGTTTCEGIGAYISHLNGITVITNNMALAAHLSEYGIRTVCTGGVITEAPYMLDGDDAIRTIMQYNTDKVFFATGGISKNGFIASTSSVYGLLHKIALEHTKESYYLVDKSKVGIDLKFNISPLSEIGTVISDFDFSDETKSKCPNTRFITV